MSNQPSGFKLSEVSKYLVSLLVLGAGVGSYFILASYASKTTDIPPTSLIPLVKTFDVTSYSGRLDIEVAGTVVPYREIRIAAEVGGRIVAKHPACEAGSFVTKGTILIEIDKANLNLDLKTTEAEIEQAEKGIAEVKQEIAGAKKNFEISERDHRIQQADFDRNVRLKNAISLAELTTSERSLLAAESAMVSIKSNISNLEARQAKLKATLDFTKSKIDRIHLNLKRATIKAPVDGVIVREMTEQDNVVSAGEQLLILEDTSRAEVLCNLTTTDLNWIREYSGKELGDIEIKKIADVYRLPKSNVTIFEGSEPGISWEGVLERFDGIGRDEVTKTFPCRIVVENPIADANDGKRALVRGMFVKCQIEVYSSAGVEGRKFIKFPTVGLRPGNYVWVVRDRKLKRIDVDIVDHTRGIFEKVVDSPFVIARQAEGGLLPGDQIVTTPLSQPTNGTVVQFPSDLKKQNEVANAKAGEPLSTTNTNREIPDPNSESSTNDNS